MSIRVTPEDGSPFATLVADARVAELERQLAAALAERDLLEQERDQALYEADRWHQRYLIAPGLGEHR